MERLDSALFPLPGLLDYEACLLPGRLEISAVTLDGRDGGLAAAAAPLLPGAEISVSCRRADGGGVPSPRKRTLL